MAKSDAGGSSNSALALVLGTAGGLLLGRVLPVLFANASGLARGAAGQDPFAGLIREHGQLLSLLDRMEATPASEPLKRKTLFLRFKRTIAKHALAEEDIIYPQLQNEADRKEAAAKLYQEHAHMKVFLFELEQALLDEEAWKARVRDLRNEIAPHARQEEEEEFPRIRALMDQKRATELSRKIYQEESLIV